MSSRNNLNAILCPFGLYQIGIRCLVATPRVAKVSAPALYQIGIRCLVATPKFLSHNGYKLYQIGIRCLVATG